jgi:hypothetical protein
MNQDEEVKAAGEAMVEKIMVEVQKVDLENTEDTFFLFKVKNMDTIPVEQKHQILAAFNHELDKMNFKKATRGKVLVLFVPWDFRFEPVKFSVEELEAVARSRGLSTIVNYYKPFKINPAMKEAEINKVISEWKKYLDICNNHIEELKAQRRNLEKHQRLMQRKKNAIPLYKFTDKNPKGKIVLLPLQSMVEQPAPEKNWKEGRCGNCDKVVWIAPKNQAFLDKGALGMCPPCGYYKAGLK